MMAHRFTFEMQRSPNKSLQLTANPLCGLSAAALCYYAAGKGVAVRSNPSDTSEQMRIIPSDLLNYIVTFH
jgi:hypothetical protein